MKEGIQAEAMNLVIRQTGGKEGHVKEKKLYNIPEQTVPAIEAVR